MAKPKKTSTKPVKRDNWDEEIPLWALRRALQEERLWTLSMVRDLVRSVHKILKEGK
jgi:hypothetical protein